MKDILDIIKNVESIYSTNSSVAILKDFERVIDELDMYVYKNWEDGELVEGPTVSRHWISAAFMWPYKKMPDPVAAKRLVDYGCKVQYEKSNLIVPIKIRDPDDYRPGTKKGKLSHRPIWIVTITMPKKLVSSIYNGYMEKIKTEIGVGRNSRVDSVPSSAADATVQGVPNAG
jgi:hypothetical protein